MEHSITAPSSEISNETLRFSIITGRISERDKSTWKATFASIASQELSLECVEIITCCPPELLRELTSLPVVNLAAGRLTRSCTQLIRAIDISTNPVCIFLEEPLILPPNFLTALNDILRSQPLISAVQPSIDVAYSATISIPDRAGFKTLFKLPILDGRLCAVRREHLIAAGGLDATCFALHWADLSWRLMLSSTIIHSTTEIPARTDKPAGAAHRLRSALYQGISLAVFIARWRVLLLKRWRRILIRLRERLFRQQRTFFEQLNLHSCGTLAIGLLEVSILAALTCLTLVPALLATRPVKLPGRRETGLYPDTFFHSNCYGLYASRISLNNYARLTTDQALYVTGLMSGTANNPSRSINKTVSPETILQLEQQLTNMDILLPEGMA